jgi:hypothetical protein
VADNPNERPSSPPKPSPPGAPLPDDGFDVEMFLLLAIVASLRKRR